MLENCCSEGCDCSNIPQNKMCQMAQPPRKFDLEKIKELTSNPEFICKCCGRTANERINLCIPAPLR